MAGKHHGAKQAQKVQSPVDKIISGLESAWGEMVREAARWKDNSIPTVTIYVQEDIGIGAQLETEMTPKESQSGQITGVYIPPAVSASATVNVILMHARRQSSDVEWARHDSKIIGTCPR